MTTEETPTHDGPMTTTLVDTTATSTAELIAQAIGEVDAVAKSRATDQGPKYQYRGIEDVLNALHPVLARLGLTLTGETLGYSLEFRDANGKERRTCTLHVRFSLVGPDGCPQVLGDWWGEGDAYDDKATNKAYSAALKLCLLQVFTIPTEDAVDTEAGPNETVAAAPAVPMANKADTDLVRDLAGQLPDDVRDWWTGHKVALEYRAAFQAGQLTKELAVRAAKLLTTRLHELEDEAPAAAPPPLELDQEPF
jgi:hypothetical protein